MCGVGDPLCLSTPRAQDAEQHSGIDPAQHRAGRSGSQLGTEQHWVQPQGLIRSFAWAVAWDIAQAVALDIAWAVAWDFALDIAQDTE